MMGGTPSLAALTTAPRGQRLLRRLAGAAAWCLSRASGDVSVMPPSCTASWPVRRILSRGAAGSALHPAMMEMPILVDSALTVVQCLLAMSREQPMRLLRDQGSGSAMEVEMRNKASA